MIKHKKISPLTGTLAALAAFATQASAQTPAPQVRHAMAKLAWLEGEWLGQGWRAAETGRETFQVSEKAEFHLDGIVLMLHGRGWSVDENGNEIESHKALGVLSFDPFAQAYRFSAYVKEGYQSHSTPEIGENEYRWSHPAGPGAEMRYHARLSEDGEWVETGERCAENVCTQIMEMRLTRISSD